MKVTYKKTYESSYYTCDLCGEKVEQDGLNICLVYGRKEENGVWCKPKEPQLHFHETCLQNHFEEEWKKD